MPDDQTARPQPNITDLALKSWDILVDAVQRYNAQIAEINNKVDPSATTTGETPFPVPAPSDGGNASERDSQGVESADFTATVRTLIAAVNSGSAETAKKLHAILRGAGLIAPEPPASERPNAGQEKATDGDALEDLRVTYSIDTDTIYVYDPVCSWWEEFERSGGEIDTAQLPADTGPLWEGQAAYNDRARAETAEAKFARQGSNFHQLRADFAETAGRLQGAHVDLIAAERERDDARSKLAEAEAKLEMPCGSCHPCVNWSDETWRREGRKLEAQRQLHNREMQQGVEAVRKLNGIREAVADFERHGTNGPRTPGSMLRDVLDILDRPAAAPAEKPPSFVVTHCCAASAVAYPNPCPWHGVGAMCGSYSPATGRGCILVGGHVIEHASGADDDEWWDPPKPGQAAEHQPAADSEDGDIAQQIEWLLIEFEGTKPENLAADEIMNRIVGPALDSLRAERDQLQARINKALALCEPHPLRHLDTQLSIAGVLRGEEES